MRGSGHDPSAHFVTPRAPTRAEVTFRASSAHNVTPTVLIVRPSDESGAGRTSRAPPRTSPARRSSRRAGTTSHRCHLPGERVTFLPGRPHRSSRHGRRTAGAHRAPPAQRDLRRRHRRDRRVVAVRRCPSLAAERRGAEVAASSRVVAMPAPGPSDRVAAADSGATFRASRAQNVTFVGAPSVRVTRCARRNVTSPIRGLAREHGHIRAPVRRPCVFRSAASASVRGGADGVRRRGRGGGRRRRPRCGCGPRAWRGCGRRERTRSSPPCTAFRRSRGSCGPGRAARAPRARAG